MYVNSSVRSTEKSRFKNAFQGEFCFQFWSSLSLKYSRDIRSHTIFRRSLKYQTFSSCLYVANHTKGAFSAYVSFNTGLPNCQHLWWLYCFPLESVKFHFWINLWVNCAHHIMYSDVLFFRQKQQERKIVDQMRRP